MAITREYRRFVADLFSVFAEIEVKPMFGGAGIYKDGIIFAMVTGDSAIYLKADDITKSRFEAEGLGPFIYQSPKGDKPPCAMPYWRMPERLFEDLDELAQWASEAFDVGIRTHKPKKSRPRKKKAPSLK